MFYLVFTAGLQITVHYCHGKIEDIKILSDKARCCCEETEMPAGNSCRIVTDDKGCCYNEHFLYQLAIDEEIIPSIKIAKQYFSEELNYQLLSILTPDVQSGNPTSNNELPPPKRQPVWLINCTFIFYG